MAKLWKRYRSGHGLYVVELFHPRSWRIAMSVEYAANCHPVRKMAEEAAWDYRRNGLKSRVVYYQARRVLGSETKKPTAGNSKKRTSANGQKWHGQK